MQQSLPLKHSFETFTLNLQTGIVTTGQHRRARENQLHLEVFFVPVAFTPAYRKIQLVGAQIHQIDQRLNAQDRYRGAW